MDTLIGFILGVLIGVAIGIFIIAILTKNVDIDMYNAGFQAGKTYADIKIDNNNNNEERGQ